MHGNERIVTRFNQHSIFHHKKILHNDSMGIKPNYNIKKKKFNTGTKSLKI